MSKAVKTNAKNVSQSEKKNQLADPLTYDVKRMIFSDPVVSQVPGDVPIAYRRVNIATRNPDGSVGDLIIPTSELFSFGVSENKSMDGKSVNGHTLPLCLWNKDGPTSEEKAWTSAFDKIVEHAKKYVLENQEALDKYDLTEADLKKFNPLYWKREKGKIVEGTGPTLYAKLIESKKHNKILTLFFDPDGNSIDPVNLMGKYCYAKAAVKIESIYVGAKISLQVKLHEAEVRIVDASIKPLLCRPKGSDRILAGGTSMNDVAAPDDDDTGSIKSDDESKPAGKPAATPAAPPAPSAPPAKRKVLAIKPKN